MFVIIVNLTITNYYRAKKYDLLLEKMKQIKKYLLALIFFGVPYSLFRFLIHSFNHISWVVEYKFLVSTASMVLSIFICNRFMSMVYKNFNPEIGDVEYTEEDWSKKKLK